MVQATLRRVLSALGAATDAANRAELADAILAAVESAVGVDGSMVTEVGPSTSIVRRWPDGFFSPRYQISFEQLHAAEPWPLVTHTRTGAGTAVRISDLLSHEEYCRTAIYADVCRPLGIHHQAAFSVPVDSQHSLCVAMSRHGRDFSAAELERAELLRRPLRASATRIAHLERIMAAGPDRGSAGLSARELDVLSLVASGLSNGAVGRRLRISPRTVNKHLEHLYVKLDVTNRTEAAALWYRGLTATRPADADSAAMAPTD